jgi:hypothetical protein
VRSARWHPTRRVAAAQEYAPRARVRPEGCAAAVTGVGVATRVGRRATLAAVAARRPPP